MFSYPLDTIIRPRYLFFCVVSFTQIEIGAKMRVEKDGDRHTDRDTETGRHRDRDKEIETKR